ncbi:MAG: MATE family efflux transporter [Lachnospiraceae bacterium]|nr:MATE family efflux transporter [Lachnospiraceae bacterium]
MQTSSQLLTEGSVRKKLLYFAAPIFLGQLFQQLYNTADSLIVGRLVGDTALAAVTSVGPISYLIVGFFLGFSMGAGVVISRDIGAGDRRSVSRGVHTTVAMGIVATVVITLIGVFLTPSILRWMDTPENVFPEASLYLRIYFLGSAGLVFYNLFVGILRAAGDSAHPLYYLIFSSLLNVVLDICFIRFFGMGVDGAALATIISQVLSAVLVLVRLLRTTDIIRVIPSEIRFDRQKLGQIVYIGLPTALQACVIDLANMMVQAYINGFGDVAMAGIGASSKLEGFIFLPVNAFSMAISTFVAQNLGAGKKDRMREGIVFGLISAVLVVELLGACLFLFSPQMVAWFNDNPEVIYYGTLRGRICGLFFSLCGFSHVSSAVMRGIGRPIVPTVVMLSCWCAVRVLVLMTIGRYVHNILLVIWIYPITWLLSALVYVCYLLYLRRKELI